MRNLLAILLFTSILSTMFVCDELEGPSETVESQFVILAMVPDSVNQNCWFDVVNVRTNISKCVYAIKEPEGTYYLPILSRLPSFNDKVVEGIFLEDSVIGMTSKDTLFEVTKLVRDTLGNFPH